MSINIIRQNHPPWTLILLINNCCLKTGAIQIPDELCSNLFFGATHKSWIPVQMKWRQSASQLMWKVFTETGCEIKIQLLLGGAKPRTRCSLQKWGFAVQFHLIIWRPPKKCGWEGGFLVEINININFILFFCRGKKIARFRRWDFYFLLDRKYVLTSTVFAACISFSSILAPQLPTRCWTIARWPL